MCSITKPNQTVLNICTRYKFSSKNISDFTNLHDEKNQIWKFCVNGIVSVIGTCVLVNGAALMRTHVRSPILRVTYSKCTQKNGHSEHPKHLFKLKGKKIITILSSKFCFSGSIDMYFQLNIVSCAVVGAYGFILALDVYVGSGMKYIVINSLRHGTDVEYVKVLVTGPFTTKGEYRKKNLS